MIVRSRSGLLGEFIRGSRQGRRPRRRQRLRKKLIKEKGLGGKKSELFLIISIL